MNGSRKLSENVKFFDRWAKTYDKPLFQFWMRRFYQPVLKLIDGGKVLDVSCGTGEFLRELAKKNKNSLYGMDLSPQMIAEARKKLPKQVRLQKADIHELPFSDNAFDYVVSTEAFHHYYDQKRALAEMKRVAKNGGKIIVVDINFFLRPVHWLFEKLEPGCVKVNSKQEMEIIFKRADLQGVTQRRNFIFSVLIMGVKR